MGSPIGRPYVWVCVSVRERRAIREKFPVEREGAERMRKKMKEEEKGKEG